MKLPDSVIQTQDPELTEWMDYTSLILNNGRYQMRIVEVIPTWDTHEGEVVLYASGTTRALYAYMNGKWCKVSYGSSGGIILPATTSLFGQFSGTGVDGDLIITSGGSWSSVAPLSGGVKQYADMTLPVGETITVDEAWMMCGVSGTLTIAGTIDADGVGYLGGVTCTGSGGDDQGYAGISAAGAGNRAVDLSDDAGRGEGGGANWEINWPVVPGCLAGAGGAGGHIINSGVGGAGGGGSGNGGVGALAIGDASSVGGAGQRGFNGKFLGLSGGLGDNSTLGYGHAMMNQCQFLGAGGGSGDRASANSGPGGTGGGCIYIECDTLVFTGTLTADGTDGASTVAAGGGGGGGGGIAIIRAKQITTNTGTVTVSGGAGGVGVSNYNGGAGADGFKNIMAVGI